MAQHSKGERDGGAATARGGTLSVERQQPELSRSWRRVVALAAWPHCRRQCQHAAFVQGAHYLRCKTAPQRQEWGKCSCSNQRL
eukprot:2067168-Prymnesium_polylepis.2